MKQYKGAGRHDLGLVVDYESNDLRSQFLVNHQIYYGFHNGDSKQLNSQKQREAGRNE